MNDVTRPYNEPGGSVAVAIIASRAPGRWAWVFRRHRAMRHFIAITLLTLAICGCTHPPKAARDGILQVWRSADSSLKQRADALTSLFPKGTSKEEIERVLDRKGMLTHYCGLSLDSINKRKLPDHDFWRVVYEFPGGGVSLEFEPAGGFGDRFVSAAPFQTLMTVPLTNSP